MVLVLAGLAVAGCSGGGGFNDVDVILVRVVDDHTLSVAIAACNANASRVDVEETADTVELRASADGGQGGDDCADGARVTLAEPLGDREVIDANTRRPVRFEN